MLNDYCFSTYARYTTLSRSDGAVLMGADNLVGIAFKRCWHAAGPCAPCSLLLP